MKEILFFIRNLQAEKDIYQGMNYFITHPLLKGVQLGSHEWFRAQKMMIRQKPLVRDCYDLWYRRLLADADSVESGTNQRVLELGSGSSYLQDLRPSIITSDVEAGLADLVVDGRSLPFGNATLSAIVMTHVMHHIPDVEQFFREVDRVLVPGGVVSMVEVTHTPFARYNFWVPTSCQRNLPALTRFANSRYAPGTPAGSWRNHECPVKM